MGKKVKVYTATCILGKVIEGIKKDEKTQKAIGRQVNEVHLNVLPNDGILSPRVVLNGLTWDTFNELLDAGNQQMIECELQVTVKRTSYQPRGISGVPGEEEAQTDPDGYK